MFLSDTDIFKSIESGLIQIAPFLPANVSNSSIDLRLGRTLIKTTAEVDYLPSGIKWDIDSSGRLTPIRENLKEEVIDIAHSPHMLSPGQFVLAETLEVVGSRALNLACLLSDKSTIARTGLSTHHNAGYIDPGNVLRITLEIRNGGHVPVELRHGMHICQARFCQLSSRVSRGYSGKYLQSNKVEAAK